MLGQRLVAHLQRQSELQIEDARLTRILDLGARVAQLGLFVASLRAGLPAVDGERALADLARLAVLLLRLQGRERDAAQSRGRNQTGDKQQ